LQTKIEATAKRWSMEAKTVLMSIYRTMYKKNCPVKKTVKQLIDLILGWVQRNRDQL